MENTSKDLLNKMRREYVENFKTLERQHGFEMSRYFENLDDCDEELDVNRLRLSSHT